MGTSVQYPQGNVVLRNLSKPLPIIVRGEGPYLFDKAGKKYFDASGGALVVSVGHGNKEVAAKIAAQLSQVGYVNGTQFTSEPTEKLASLLARYADPLGLDRVFFLNSGSEATEAAIKFARQLCVERKQEKRTKIIARMPSYHGNTLFALSASGRPHYKKYYGPLLSDVLTLATPVEYRYAGNYAESADKFAKEFEDLVKREGPEEIFAFIAEPVVGSSAGGALPPPGYFEKIQEICRRYGILIIADEVMVGAGRTGKFFASEWFGLEPDILTLGKGLNGGYTALSAVLVKQAHVDEMKKGSGYFMHAQTFMQAPCMTAVGLAVLEYMKEHQVVENSRRVGDYLHKGLHQKFDNHPNVGFISGKGLFAGIEFVADKKTGKPFPRSEKVVERLVTHALDQGITLWPNSGNVNGVDGDLVMLGPPLTITTGQADELLRILEGAIQSFFSAPVAAR
jgi:adenosylmethionine-8-amino-7-oxononanoate aminotransferase